MARKTNCEKNGRSYYRVSITTGYEQGKQKKKDFYGDTKSEALAKRDAYLSEIASGINIDMAKQPLCQSMSIWLYEVKKKDHDLKATSFERYEGVYRNYIKDSTLGRLAVSEIKSIHVQRFLNELEKRNPLAAEGDEIGCTHYQMKNVIKVLKMFFIYATNEGYTLRNPALRIAIPGDKPVKEEVETFNDEEIDKIKAALVGHRLRLVVLMALGTGLRRGELLALRYTDIKAGFVNVRSSLSQPTVINEEGKRSNEFIIWEPKTSHSIRQVPIPEALEKEITAHRARQISERMELGIGGEPEFVFTTETSRFYDSTNFTTAFTRLLKKAGVPYKKFHALRHTYATRLVQAGTPLPTVQKLMGHSSIAITSIYTHSSLDDRREAVKVLNELFN